MYAERLREFAPEQVRLIGEPSPGALATLYRTASVIADAAWTPRGHGRIMTAAALGAAVVCSQSRWLELPADRTLDGRSGRHTQYRARNRRSLGWCRHAAIRASEQPLASPGNGSEVPPL